METHAIDTVELSGNIEHIPYENLVRLLKDNMSRKKIYIHNYFPIPSQTFVLNLAHPETIEKSIKFCRKTIDLCSELGIELYSVHAGMAFNPDAKSLGKKQSFYPAICFDKSRDLLIESFTHIADYAANRGVRLLLENNVVTKYNCKDGVNKRYHFADLEETQKLLALFSHPNIGVLLDLGHLKVSAKTLGFDPLSFIRLVKDKIEAVHLSENNGKEDQNLPVSKDAWYWPHVPWGRIQYISVEIKPHSMQQIQEQVKIVKNAVARYRN